MGHREDLLEGAKRCLLEKGFARTTARDIVKASGTNLASIGYHYGSKDALLAQAYVEMVGQLSQSFDGDGEGRPEPASEPGSLEHFREVWTNVIATMKEPDSLWRLSMEALTMGDRLPELREHLARAQRESDRGLVAMFTGGREEDVPEETVDTLGRLYTTLLLGLVAQWTFNPAGAPGADALTEGLRQVMEAARPQE